MISRMHRLVLFIGLLTAALLTGCYNRWTGNYSQVPDLTAESVSVLETSEMTEEDHQRQLEILHELAVEGEPGYTINGGDKLAITVYNNEDLSTKTVVTPDGYLGMVLVGQIKVSGLTIAEASKKIEDALAKYIRNPKVGLSPYEIVSENATIAGAVNSPGIVPIYNGMRLADLFAKAGGSASRYTDGQTISAADFDNSIFVRNGKTIPVDFTKAIEHGDPLHNILLRRGDYIFIAASDSNMVYVIGDVKKPGQRVWHQQLGILEVLSQAGWTNETCWDHAIIIRGGMTNPKMFKIDVDGIVTGKVPDVYVKPGDVIYVPHDNITEYNVFIRKLMPTAQLINMLITPATWIRTF